MAKLWKQPKYILVGKGINKNGMPTNEILPSNKKEPAINTYNYLDESQRHYAEWKNPVLKMSILYDSNKTFPKWQNCSDREQISGCQGLRIGRVWL